MIYFSWGIFYFMITWGLLFVGKVPMKSRLIFSTIAFFVGSFFSYLINPVISLFEPDFWFLSFTPVFLISFALFLSNNFKKINLYIIIFSIFLLFIFPFVTTSAIFHSDKYHGLLEVVEEQSFNSNEILLDQNKARFVDQDLSIRAANEILGQVRGMGSRYNIGTMRIQNVDDELQWVAPFEHSSIFRWFDNKTSPGYVTVSSSDYSNALMHIDDHDINFGMNGFYFSNNIRRHLYRNGYATTRLEDYTLEITPEGKPMWAVSIIERKVGFSGKIATGVVVVDANTGEFTEYSIDESPDWINRIQPEDIVNKLIQYWGQYSDGWWNGFAIGDGVITSTPGTSLVFTQDQTSSWYTGMQSKSASNKESTMGFMLVDSRTGQANFYQRSGITETVARSAIEGRVQEANYSASVPIPYNINGQVTFLSILKDRSGNMQGIGLVAYDDRSKVAVGENFDIALRRYASTLAEHSGIDNLDASIEVFEITGTIDRAYLQSFDNRLVLNFTLLENEHHGKFFISQADNNKEVMLSREGDEVSFKTYSLDNRDIQTFDFRNFNF